MLEGRGYYLQFSKILSLSNKELVIVSAAILVHVSVETGID